MGCSSKTVNFDTPSAINSSEVESDSIAERVLYGSLVIGVGALMLTTLAVVILLLVPKTQVQRER